VSAPSLPPAALPLHAMETARSRSRSPRQEQHPARLQLAPVGVEWMSEPLRVFTQSEVISILAMRGDPMMEVKRVQDAVRCVFPVGTREEQAYGQALTTAFPEYSDLLVEEICCQLLCASVLVREAAVTWQPSRKLSEFLEFFAGDGNLSSAMERAGVPTKAFDVRYTTPDAGMQNLMTSKGLRYAFVSIIFTTKDADVWAGIVCSSWVWVSRGTTKRSNDATMIWGDEQIPSVRLGNSLATRVVGLCLFTSTTDGRWCVEQPISSLLWLFPPFARLLSFAQAKKTVTYLGAFGAQSQKPVVLMHTSEWVHLLRRPRPLQTFSLQLVQKDTRGKVTGIKAALKGSQSYPPEFGQVAANAKVVFAQGGGGGHLTIVDD
jgi:hypothetical protein